VGAKENPLLLLSVVLNSVDDPIGGAATNGLLLNGDEVAVNAVMSIGDSVATAGMLKGSSGGAVVVANTGGAPNIEMDEVKEGSCPKIDPSDVFVIEGAIAIFSGFVAIDVTNGKDPVGSVACGWKMVFIVDIGIVGAAAGNSHVGSKNVLVEETDGFANGEKALSVFCLTETSFKASKAANSDFTALEEEEEEDKVVIVLVAAKVDVGKLFRVEKLLSSNFSINERLLAFPFPPESIIV
jgi:hypothetical protein